MLISGVIKAVKILEAECKPFAEKKSIGDMSVMIHPAMIEQLKDSQRRCFPNSGIDCFSVETIEAPGECPNMRSNIAVSTPNERYPICMYEPPSGT